VESFHVIKLSGPGMTWCRWVSSVPVVRAVLRLMAAPASGPSCAEPITASPAGSAVKGSGTLNGERSVRRSCPR